MCPEVFLSVCRFDHRVGISPVCVFSVPQRDCLDDAARLATMLTAGASISVTIFGELGTRWRVEITPGLRAAAARRVREIQGSSNALFRRTA